MRRITYIIAAIALTATTQRAAHTWTWAPIIAAPLAAQKFTHTLWITNTIILATAAASIATASTLTPLHVATAIAIGTVAT